MIKTTSDFINYIHPDGRTIVRMTPNGKRKPRTISTDDIESDIMVGSIVILPNLGGISDSQIYEYPLFFAEVMNPPGSQIDMMTYKDQKRRIIDDFPIPPTFVIETSRGYTIGWVLSNPLQGDAESHARDVWTETQDILRQHFRGDRRACRPTCTIPLPFTYDFENPISPERLSIERFEDVRHSAEDFRFTRSSFRINDSGLWSPEIRIISAGTTKETEATEQIDPMIALTDADIPYSEIVAMRLGRFLRLDLQNPMIRLILTEDPDGIRNMMLVKPMVVDSMVDMHEYVTHKVDLREFFGLPHAEKFPCPFHDDLENSATVFTSMKGENFFKCNAPSCRVQGNIWTLVNRIVGGSKSRTIRFLKTALAIEDRETEWQRECRELLLGNRDNVRTMIAEYTDLQRNLKRDLRMYDLLIDIATEYLFKGDYTSNLTGRPIFFASFSYLMERYGMGDMKSVRTRIKILAYHNLIRLIPDDEIPLAMLENARRMRFKNNHGTEWRVTYFEIPELTPLLLEEANEIAERYRRQGLTRQIFTRDALCRTDGIDVAAKCFEQGTLTTTTANDLLVELLTNHIEEKLDQENHCIENELVELVMRKRGIGKTESNRHVKGLLPSILRDRGWVRKKTTNPMKSALGVKSKGNVLIILARERAENERVQQRL